MLETFILLAGGGGESTSLDYPNKNHKGWVLKAKQQQCPYSFKNG